MRLEFFQPCKKKQIVIMRSDGEQLVWGCSEQDPQVALQLLNSWDAQRIRSAVNFATELVSPFYCQRHLGHVNVHLSMNITGLQCHCTSTVVNFCVWRSQINPQNADTPLTWAAFWGHVEIAKILLKHDAEIEAKDVVSPLNFVSNAPL